MEEHSPTVPGSTPGALGTTALGRLLLKVPDEDGFEEVTVERRWPDVRGARAWCERIVAKAACGIEVMEIQVFEESWRHSRSWETTANHPVPEALQVGVVGEEGVRWSELRPMTPRVASRAYF